jgi:hypothetical protein
MGIRTVCLSYLVIDPVVKLYIIRVVMRESVLCDVSLKRVWEASNEPRESSAFRVERIGIAKSN